MVIPFGPKPTSERQRGAGGRPRRPGVTDAILDATMELAADGGLEELTLDAIAVRAGVGRPTIYRRWPSKDALLEEAVVKMLKRYNSVTDSGNIRDDLIVWARAMMEMLQGPLRSLWAAYFNVQEAYLLPAEVVRTRDGPIDLVQQAIERRELRSDTDPRMLLGLIFGMIWHQVNNHHRHLKTSFARDVVDAVLNSWFVASTEPSRDR